MKRGKYSIKAPAFQPQGGLKTKAQLGAQLYGKVAIIQQERSITFVYNLTFLLLLKLSSSQKPDKEHRKTTKNPWEKKGP